MWIMAHRRLTEAGSSGLTIPRALLLVKEGCDTEKEHALTQRK